MTSCRSEPDLQTRWQNDLQNVTEKCSQVPPPGCGDPHASETRMHTRRIRGEWDWNILTTFDNIWQLKLSTVQYEMIDIYIYLCLFDLVFASCHVIATSMPRRRILMCPASTQGWARHSCAMPRVVPASVEVALGKWCEDHLGPRGLERCHD